MSKLSTMTNATKAMVVSLINAVLGLLVVFGVNVSDNQQSAILLVVNCILALWVSLTYKNSPKRIVDSGV